MMHSTDLTATDFADVKMGQLEAQVRALSGRVATLENVVQRLMDLVEKLSEKE